MVDLEQAKFRAAEKALDFIQDGMVVGLGTGTTVKHLVRLLADRVQRGLRIRGIATSIATETMALDLGIPLITLADRSDPDLVIDGADEVDPHRDLIKGAGGALVREKVLASASRQRIIMVDETKLVPILGRRFPVPVEVVPFALPTAGAALLRLGARVQLREKDGNTFVTDNGNRILDAHFGEIADPARLEREITAIPGVVDCGLFVGFNPIVIVATEDGTRILS